MKATEGMDGYSEYENVSDKSCGERMLQDGMGRGFGDFINNDLKRFKSHYTDVDLEVDRKYYITLH